MRSNENWRARVCWQDRQKYAQTAVALSMMPRDAHEFLAVLKQATTVSHQPGLWFDLVEFRLDGWLENMLDLVQRSPQTGIGKCHEAVALIAKDYPRLFKANNAGGNESSQSLATEAVLTPSVLNHLLPEQQTALFSALMTWLCAIDLVLSHVFGAIIWTLRSTREGGTYSGDVADQTFWLSLILKHLHPTLVDLEMSMGQGVIFDLSRLAHQNDVGVILSWHVWDGLPMVGAVQTLVKQMKTGEPTVYKLAFFIRNKEALRRFDAIQKQAGFSPQDPVIWIGMGSYGTTTRIPTLDHTPL